MGTRTLRFDKAFKLFTMACSHPTGRRIGPSTAEVDFSSGCQQPKVIEVVGRRERFVLKYHTVVFDGPATATPNKWESVTVIMHCKCRQCEVCLKKRRQHWWFRAKYETTLAPRTWFCTFTFSPEALFRAELVAKRTARRKALDWDVLTEKEQRKRVLDAAGADLTLFFKRLRKLATAPLRYLLVSEYGEENDRLHFHALIHETKQGCVKYEFLRKNWRMNGFGTFKLADEKAPSYVAKYISKDAQARVRSSVRYGQNDRPYALAEAEGTK